MYLLNIITKFHNENCCRTYPFFHSFAIKELIRHLVRRDNGLNDKVVFTEPQGKYMSDIFSKMNAYSKEHNIAVVIVYLSHRYNEYSRKYSKELRKIVKGSGLNYIDVSLPFRKTNFNEYKIHTLDAHPNGKANRIFADKIYARLNKNLFVKRKDD